MGAGTRRCSDLVSCEAPCGLTGDKPSLGLMSPGSILLAPLLQAPEDREEDGHSGSASSAPGRGPSGKLHAGETESGLGREMC